MIKVVQESGNTTIEKEIAVEQLGGDPDILLELFKRKTLLQRRRVLCYGSG